MRWIRCDSKGQNDFNAHDTKRYQGSGASFNLQTLWCVSPWRVSHVMVALLSIGLMATSACNGSTSSSSGSGKDMGGSGQLDGTTRDGTPRDGTQVTGDGSRIDTTIGTSFSPTNQPGCGDIVSQCNDGKDNDGDHLIDALDPECVGPCDNDESSFQTGISGDNVDACKQDCFFDGNSGQGDDGCEWNLKCDSTNPGGGLAKACPYDPNFSNCPTTQKEACLNACLPYTPNGCDCFGCCQVRAQGRIHNIYLGSPNPKCGLNALDKCLTCTFSQDCFNTCAECELCMGKTMADIPSHCFGPSQGDAGVTDAGANDAGSVVVDASGPQECKPELLPECTFSRTRCCTRTDCATGSYCQTGCCLTILR